MSLIDKHYEFNYPLNIHIVFERIAMVAHNVQGLSFGRASDQDFTVVLNGGLSWFSYGEIVTISCMYLDERNTRIHIKSAPVVPFTLVDYGKGKKNIHNVLNALKEVLPPIP